MLTRCNVVHDDAMIADDEGDWVLYADYAELEAKLERCMRLAASLAMQAYQHDRSGLIRTLAWHPNYSDATLADIRAAIETPGSGTRREGEG